MPVLDYANFLKNLAAWLAVQASLSNTNTSRAIWEGAANEGFATDPYSVLRTFGGGVQSIGLPTFSIQCKTFGKDAAAAMTRAALIFSKLLDANGRALRMATFAVGGTSVRINKVELQQPPSLVSVDDRGRAEVVFNFDLEVVPLS